VWDQLRWKHNYWKEKRLTRFFAEEAGRPGSRNLFT
jgi:hypothetical protein